MQFDHVGVLVTDYDAAKSFAHDVLGLGDPVAEFEAPEHGLAGAFFGMGAGRLELFTFEEPGERKPGIDHFAVTVADIAATQAELAAKGVRFTGPRLPDEVSEPVEIRGALHLWTVPETCNGFRLQITQPPA